MKARSQGRLLKAVHEGASDLHQAGFISKRRMREFDALCLDPIPVYNKAAVADRASGTASEMPRSRVQGGRQPGAANP